MLQEQLGDTRAQENSNDAFYSPTSPLQLDFSASESDESSTAESMVTSQHQQIILGFQCQFVFFSGKSRRNGVLKRSRSAGSTFLFTGNEEKVRRAKRKKRYEEWDAKGGFSLRQFPTSADTYAKALTDVSMARDMGVEASFLSGSVERKKRGATVSPMDPTGDWSSKRSRTSSPDLHTDATA